MISGEGGGEWWPGGWWFVGVSFPYPFRPPIPFVPLFCLLRICCFFFSSFLLLFYSALNSLRLHSALIGL